MALRTPLYSCHTGLGARMIDFAGWDMPLQYTSIVAEHTAVRSGAGVFDISHMGRLWFSGPKAMDFVQQVYTNDAAGLKEDQARYGLVCNDEGGIRDDVLVYRLKDRLGMVVNASNRIKILDWINQHRPHTGVELRDATPESCMLAVQGPLALETCRGLVDGDPGSIGYYFAIRTAYRGEACLMSRTGYTGEDGFELIVAADQGPQLWSALCSRGATPCGLGARDTLRLESAMPLYGHELNEEIDPFQAGLGWAVKLDKGPFIGREALRARRAQGPQTVRVGLEIEGKRVAREGASVFRQDQRVGEVTSGTYAPTLNKVIAMAYLDMGSAQPGVECLVDVRGKLAAARVVPLPFYKRKQKR
jgi:aminomethyltransferase